MVECNKCYQVFKYKCHLERHLSSKTSCDKPEKIIKNITIKINEIDNEINTKDNLSIESKTKCSYCETIFNKKYNMTRHIQTSCDIRKQILENKNNYQIIIESKNKEIEEIKNNKQKEEVKKLKKQLKKNKIQNIQQNIQNLQSANEINNNDNKNTNINITLNNNQNLNEFGKEDLSHITLDDYKYYITNLLPGFIKYIEDIHFSDKMLSNRNICYSKIDSNHISTYKNNKWNASKKNDLLHDYVTKKIRTLDSKCNELENKKIIDEQKKDIYDDFINNYYARDDKERKEIYEDIALMLFNNRNKIDNYKQLLK
jgi:hypothetical protein